MLGSGMINEFKFGYNAAPSTDGGVAPAGFENILLNLSGTVANTGIAGQARHVRARVARAASSASTARATAAARRTTRTR